VGQGLDGKRIRKYPMLNVREPAETRSTTMFHAMSAEMLASEGFEKNLQQF
jgi:hypothetical protein